MLQLIFNFRIIFHRLAVHLFTPPLGVLSVCASSREAEIDVPSLTYSEEETIILAAELNKLLVAETRSGQSYLKKYDEMVASPLKPTVEPTKPSAKRPVEK